MSTPDDLDRPATWARAPWAAKVLDLRATPTPLPDRLPTANLTAIAPHRTDLPRVDLSTHHLAATPVSDHPALVLVLSHFGRADDVAVALDAPVPAQATLLRALPPLAAIFIWPADQLDLPDPPQPIREAFTAARILHDALLHLPVEPGDPPSPWTAGLPGPDDRVLTRAEAFTLLAWACPQVRTIAEAQQWRKVGVRAGLSLAAWREAGWTDPQIRSWAPHFDDVAHAQAYYRVQFEPEHAATWMDGAPEVHPETAHALAREGFTPADGALLREVIATEHPKGDFGDPLGQQSGTNDSRMRMWARMARPTSPALKILCAAAGLGFAEAGERARNDALHPQELLTLAALRGHHLSERDLLAR